MLHVVSKKRTWKTHDRFQSHMYLQLARVNVSRHRSRNIANGAVVIG